MSRPKVVIVIVNWNGWPHLKKCLDSVLRQSYPNYRVIVVDNGSSDGSASYTRNHFPSVTVLPNRGNLGFAEGTNIGIQEALNDGDVRYVAALNNDTTVDEGWLDPIIDIMEADDRIGSAQPLVAFMDRPHIVENAGITVFRDGGAANRYMNESVVPGPIEEIFGCCAAAAVYRRDALEDVGLLDRAFGSYFEDVDLAWRLRLRSWRSVLVPRSHILHVHSGSSSSPLLKLRLINRNIVFVLIKNFPFRYIPFFPILYIQRRLRSLPMRKRPGSDDFIGKLGTIKVIGMILGAWISAIKHLPSLIRKRRNIQGSRSVRTKDLRPWFGI